jgi:hypothetical protein
MYNSLTRQCDHFHLYIIPLDDLVEKKLLDLNLNNVTIISLIEFENERLLEAKKNRTQGEYCWTCSSSSILYILNTYNVSSCTYIDADLFFLSDPSCLIEEMGEKDVLITAHRYSEKYKKSELLSGRYCVQFVTIKSTPNGLKILNWWVDKCIEWCYNRYDLNRFGDQKYLDYWPLVFNGVHELIHEGGGLAPWNIDNYIYKDGQVINVFTNTKWTIIFYHFHGLRFFKNNTIFFTSYPLKKWVYNIFYNKYAKEACSVYDMLSKKYNTEIGLIPVKLPYSSFNEAKYSIKKILLKCGELFLLTIEALQIIFFYKYLQQKYKCKKIK